MSFVIGFLTVVMVLTCLLLILLVLIQLPKKEAGIGQAFGSATTDALFGAGSGNALTKITKYAIGTVFVLWMLLGLLQSHFAHRATSGLEENYGHREAPASTPAPYAAPAAAPSAAPVAPASNKFTLPQSAAPSSSAATSAPAK